MNECKHLKILGKSNKNKLENVSLINIVLKELVKKIGMQIIGEPIIYNIPLQIEKIGREPFEDEGGITITLVLSTSHCAIHTWPLRNEFHLDIYSCRFFSKDIIIDYLKDMFEITDLKISDLTSYCEW